jgi:hypothetical protein
MESSEVVGTIIGWHEDLGPTVMVEILGEKGENFTLDIDALPVPMEWIKANVGKKIRLKTTLEVI